MNDGSQCSLTRFPHPHDGGVSSTHLQRCVRTERRSDFKAHDAVNSMSRIIIIVALIITISKVYQACMYRESGICSRPPEALTPALCIKFRHHTHFIDKKSEAKSLKITRLVHCEVSIGFV